MSHVVDRRRIWVFLSLAFGLSWLAALVIWGRGGILNSPPLAPGSAFTEAWLLTTLFYMSAPAVASLLTRLLTGEGFANMGLRPRIRANWRPLFGAWFGTAFLVLAGTALTLVLFPQFFDGDLTQLTDLISTLEAQTGQAVPLSPAALLFVQIVQAVLLGPLLNLLPILGEELGWRAYLLPKLMFLGQRRGLLLLGVIWGIWHWPLLAMGHAYGIDYPGAPWAGFLAFTVFTTGFGTLLGWLTLRAGSVWPAVFGHGVLNALAGVGSLLVTDGANPVIGPTPAGIIGSLGFSIVAIWLLTRSARRARAAAWSAPLTG